MDSVCSPTVLHNTVLYDDTMSCRCLRVLKLGWGGGSIRPNTLGPRVPTVGQYREEGGWVFFYPKNSWYPLGCYVPTVGTLTPHGLVGFDEISSA